MSPHLNLLAALTLWLLPSALTAQTPPPNDECAGAVTLLPDEGVNDPEAELTLRPFTTVGATPSTPDTTCAGGNNDDDVWFSFTGTGTPVNLWFRQYTILPDTARGALTYELFDACGGTSLGCEFQDIQRAGGRYYLGGQPLVTELGREYKLRLFTNNETPNDGATFTIALEKRPPNDECALAVPLTVYPMGEGVMTATTTVAASRSLPSPACTTLSGDDDVWYSFTGTGTPVALKTANITVGQRPSRLAIELLEGGCDGRPLDCYRQETGEGETLTLNNGVPLPTGQSYALRVFSQNSGVRHTITADITLEEISTTSNDEESLSAATAPSLNKATVFPNPTFSSATVTCHGGHGAVSLRVLDLAGREVAARTISGGPEVIEIDLSNRPAGVYLVHLRDAVTSFTTRVVRR